VLNATWFVLAGMGIVFATLSLLVLVMSALNRWLGPEPEATARADGRPGTRGARTTRAGHA
jgi:Na+-transporting methylmalonyl-CoA/oxaloacetate decarboxylase gamma subunit